MAKKNKLSKHGHEFPTGSPIEFDAADADDFANADPVVAWVFLQREQGGPSEVGPPVAVPTGKWSDVKDGLTFTPTVKGFYTLMIVGSQGRRPISFRSRILRVT